MNNDLRNLRQREFADQWLNSAKFSILNLCPRFGKIYTAINILEKMDNPNVLIAYPDKAIKASWEEDFKTRGYCDLDVTYSTHLGLKKHIGEQYDIIIIDEIHLLSEAQIEACYELFKNNFYVLGLTGTLNKYSKKTLYDELLLPVLAEYTIKQAIEEGVIVDYQISIIKVPLDSVQMNLYGKVKRTELQHFVHQGVIIRAIERKGGSTMFPRLARMRVVQKSVAKLKKTKELLSQFKNERILVFCGLTDIADSLGIPSYHNKVKERDVFDDFASGKGNHLAVVKIGNTGVTYKPLDKVIINYFDSNAENLAQKINRCMGMEYNTPDKKAHIYIITSDQDVELKWLNKALAFFDSNKITYL
jgi:superfamily II DNA or RNA helicase